MQPTLVDNPLHGSDMESATDSVASVAPTKVGGMSTSISTKVGNPITTVSGTKVTHPACGTATVRGAKAPHDACDPVTIREAKATHYVHDTATVSGSKDSHYVLATDLTSSKDGGHVSSRKAKAMQFDDHPDDRDDLKTIEELAKRQRAAAG